MASRSSALQQAFDHWLAHQRSTGRLRRSASVAVYQAMWQALVAWCRTQKPAPRLADLQGTTLPGYLASRHGMRTADGVLSPRYQQRLVSLVRRVQAHQAWRAQQADAGPGQALALATAAPPHRQASISSIKVQRRASPYRRPASHAAPVNTAASISGHPAGSVLRVK